MLRRGLFEPDYRPRFTGHETFPLRYGWLRKAFDEVRRTDEKAENESVFSGDDAIARFGVGKNMIASIRHWATVADVVQDPGRRKRVKTTRFGEKLFGESGLDPFMENPASLWLVHWKLCSPATRTTWHWVFNYYPATIFVREQLVQNLEHLAKKCTRARASEATIKRDVECFVRTYATRPLTEKTCREDALESPLAELGLIRTVGKRDCFRLVRGMKPSLGNGVFTYALMDFWLQKAPHTNTMSFETAAYEPGSPCRVFLLDESDLSERLLNIEHTSNGFIQWSETSGLKQLLRRREFSDSDALSFIGSDYRTSSAA